MRAQSTVRSGRGHRADNRDVAARRRRALSRAIATTTWERRPRRTILLTPTDRRAAVKSLNARAERTARDPDRAVRKKDARAPRPHPRHNSRLFYVEDVPSPWNFATAVRV